jgi:hypothetical protein
MDREGRQVKVAMLLSAMGPDGVTCYNHFEWGDKDKAKFKDEIAKFDTGLGGEKRIAFKLFKFWDYKRAEHQPFEEYFTQLKSMAQLCEFADNDKGHDCVFYHRKFAK